MLAIASFITRDRVPPKCDIWRLIAAFITDFLVADMTLERACELSHIGSTSLLNFIWSRRLRYDTFTFAELLQTEPVYSEWEFPRAMTQALRRGDLTLVQWILTHIPGIKRISQILVKVAAENGNMRVLQLLQESNTIVDIEWDPRNIYDVANSGLWDFVPWLRERTDMLSEKRTIGLWLVDCAFNQHDLKKIKWAIESELGGDCIHFEECLEISWQTRKEILRYFLAEEYGDIQRMCIDAVHQAVQMGDLEFVQWILEQGSHVQYYGPAKAMFSAAENGQLHIVQWLYENYADNEKDVRLFKENKLRVPNEDSPDLFRNQDLKPVSAMDAAAKYGHLDVLQFLQSVGAVSTIIQSERRSVGCTTMAMDAAAANGHLEVVKWLHGNRTEGCTTTAMDRSAANGHLEVLQWLHVNRSEGCTTFALDKAAARRYHVPSCQSKDMMQCCQTVTPLAFQEKQFAVVHWLHSNRSEGCTTRAMDGAAANGSLKMLQWLHHNTEAGCTYKATGDAAANGHVHVVQWLHEIRSVNCSQDTMKRAATEGNLKITKWLKANCSYWSPEMAMKEAARCGQLRVVRWLLAHCPGIRIRAPMSKTNPLAAFFRLQR